MPQHEEEPDESATLIIWGGGFDPVQVTQLLGWEPSQSWRKGDTKSFRRPDGSVRVFDSYYEWSGWKLWLDTEHRSKPLIDQLQHWGAALLKHGSTLERLRAEGATVEINCCISTSGSGNLQIPHELQAQFGNLGVDLDVTFYG